MYATVRARPGLSVVASAAPAVTTPLVATRGLASFRALAEELRTRRRAVSLADVGGLAPDDLATLDSTLDSSLARYAGTRHASGVGTGATDA